MPSPVGETRGVVGILILRSYVLADDAGHYDGVIEALETRGLRVLPAFASGLDGRPAIERFLKQGERERSLREPAIAALLELVKEATREIAR